MRGFRRHDEAGRPIEHDSDGDGVVDTRWETDRGCANAVGRLCRLVEPRLTTEFEYDLRGRITENRWVVNGATYTARNVFDALGRVRRHIYPDGSAVDYEFNQRGMVSRIPGILDVATYTDDGQPQERRFTSGIRERRQYDARFRWTGLGYVGPSGQVLEDTTRTLDRVGMITAVRDGRPDRTAEDDRSESYEYNDREQLVKSTGRYGEIRWRWDAAARLLERTSSVAMMNLGALTYPMNVTDAQPHGARRAGRHTLEYDADGNVRSLDGRPFRWDARNYNVELSDERGRTEESWYDPDASPHAARANSWTPRFSRASRRMSGDAFA
jgi:YD repeat-containing protein